MNKDQVEEAKKKQKVILTAANDNTLKDIFVLHDFKVAIAYGHRERAWSFMAKAGDLIIYGADTWATLTGDEYNAFRLFLAGIQYKIEQNAPWTLKDFELAVDNYVEIFYLGAREKKEELCNLAEYNQLYSQLNK